MRTTYGGPLVLGVIGIALAMVAVMASGCGNVTAEQIGQINDAVHAYPDVAEAWAFMPVDASVYAEQRFGIGRTSWLLMHIEKQGVAGDGGAAIPVSPTAVVDESATANTTETTGPVSENPTEP